MARDEPGQLSTQPSFPGKCHSPNSSLNSSKNLQYPKLLQHGSSHFRANANGQITHFSQLFPPKVKVAETHITTAFQDLDLLSLALFWMKGGYSLSTSYVPGSLEAFWRINEGTQTQYNIANEISFLSPLKVLNRGRLQGLQRKTRDKRLLSAAVTTPATGWAGTHQGFLSEANILETSAFPNFCFLSFSCFFSLPHFS